jgi:hypothetical protein
LQKVHNFAKFRRVGLLWIDPQRTAATYPVADTPFSDRSTGRRMKSIDELNRELEVYEDLWRSACELDMPVLAANSRNLAEETLAQIWAVRKEQEEQKPKGLYYAKSS